jgi:lipopolysaccharide/colanic/teichoic acid biosynthesis glycosyltransferase
MIAPIMDDALRTDMNPQAVRRSRLLRYELIKRMFDFGFSALLLVLTSPLMLLSMIAVRVNSKGSPVYTQKRLGHHGRIITIYKIRTMYKDSERYSGPVWSGPGDPRVTPIGRVLRASHLDELPQLLNVMRGEMSLIGPRPERPEIATQIERTLPGYRDRLLVRPGVTGVAQVLQAPDTDLRSVHRKLKYDFFYLERMGFLLDLRIILATVLHLLHVPASSIARIFQFPDDSLHTGDESSLCGANISVSTQVQPYYLN